MHQSVLTQPWFLFRYCAKTSGRKCFQCQSFPWPRAFHTVFFHDPGWQMGAQSTVTLITGRSNSPTWAMSLSYSILYVTNRQYSFNLKYFEFRLLIAEYHQRMYRSCEFIFKCSLVTEKNVSLYFITTCIPRWFWWGVNSRRSPCIFSCLQLYWSQSLA